MYRLEGNRDGLPVLYPRSPHLLPTRCFIESNQQGQKGSTRRENGKSRLGCRRKSSERREGQGTKLGWVAGRRDGPWTCTYTVTINLKSTKAPRTGSFPRKLIQDDTSGVTGIGQQKENWTKTCATEIPGVERTETNTSIWKSE